MGNGSTMLTQTCPAAKPNVRFGKTAAWANRAKRDGQDGKIGIVDFDIPFKRHFYLCKRPRPLEKIDADLKACTYQIKGMIEELSA